MATFIELSCLITGFTDLDETLAALYQTRMQSKPDWAIGLDALMAAADAALNSDDPEISITNAMKQDPGTVGAAARRLAHFWYTGRAPNEGGADAPFESATAYFSALMWRAARAHPPGLSGGFTGHWRYAPDG